MNCQYCNGSGYDMEGVCDACEGTGMDYGENEIVKEQVEDWP